MFAWCAHRKVLAKSEVITHPRNVDAEDAGRLAKERIESRGRQCTPVKLSPGKSTRATASRCGCLIRIKYQDDFPALLGRFSDSDLGRPAFYDFIPGTIF
jgi:hypothetical protein